MIQPDKIIRSDRKTLSVCIDCFGNVTVRAPRRCDTVRIFAFLEQKETWILRKKAERVGVCTALPPENLDGYEFSLLGKNCAIHLYERNKITFDAEKNQLFLPQKKAHP